MQETFLRTILLSQQENFRKKSIGIPRSIELEKTWQIPLIKVIIGPRRAGKSTLLRQMAELKKKYLYINFDDERMLGFEVNDFQKVLDFAQNNSNCRTLLFDEIQNVQDWERFVRRAHDEGYEIAITGSNANLLSGELSTRLTGRHYDIELLPFSFQEYLSWSGVKFSQNRSFEKRAELAQQFDDYLLSGGFPERITTGKSEILSGIYEDVIYRDIIARYNIRDITGLRQLAQYCFTEIGKEISYLRMARTLNMKNSVTVKTFMSYLETVYMIFEIRKFNYSPRKLLMGNKKIYTIDLALREEIALSSSDDSGRKLENLVYLELKRRGLDIYFHQEKHECDFVVKGKKNVNLAIQVTKELSIYNREREIEGLREAITKHPSANGLILTHNSTGEELINGKKIAIMPIWEWMIG